VNSPTPSRITVLGPGLLGGSLLMALRQRHPEVRLQAWARRQESVEEVLKRNAADHASTEIASACEGADLIVLCTTVDSMSSLAKEIASAKTAPNCVVTDVGSVKAPVVDALEEVLQKSGCQFVGSHPMAGSERAGLDAAKADLFEGAVCILTPTLFTTDHALQTARWLWTLLGCRLLEMPPDEHDRKAARISHLAHLTAVVTTLAALRPDISAADCAGNGFRDTTRIAAGDPAMWTGIVGQNRNEVVAALKDAREALAELLETIENQDYKGLLQLLREAKHLRDAALSRA
jgi:prephenate dehydrogenase